MEGATSSADNMQAYPPSVRLPDQRARRSALSRVLTSLVVIVALAALLAGVALFVGYAYYNATGPLQAAKTVEIKRGLRTPEIAVALQDAGVIANPELFSAAAYLTGSRGRLKAGEYEFPAGASVRQALDIIVSGKALKYKLLIPEGFTVQQALERVKNQSVLTGDLTVLPPEGMIMPDTHVFQRGISRDELVATMQTAQKELLEELWQQRAKDLPFDTKEEALVLASIVEKETARSDERPRVAAVFVNRLRQGMRLQSDPTIIYGIVGGKGRLDRPITKQDIAQKTPYNTYRINGLPPGPISNPGRAAIAAVLNPPDTKELYFVADGTGGHAFAETLDQHKLNVEAWRKIERERKAGQEAEDIADAKQETGDDATDAAAAAAAASQPAAVEGQPASGEAAAPDPNAAAAEALAPAPMPAEGVATPLPEAKPMPDMAELETAEISVAVAPEAPVAEVVLNPGDVVTVSDRLVPIPVPKPKR